MSDWIQDGTELHLKAGVLDLTVWDCGESGASAWIKLGNLCLWRGGRKPGELTVETAKADSIAKAREFAQAITAALPPLPAGPLAGLEFRPFVSRCQVCMEKHHPRCEGAAP